MAPSSSKFTSLQKGAATRQCSNAHCRQETLKSLHDALRSRPLDIISAIQDDTNTSHMAASTEFAYGLDLVESHYKSINPANEHEREYRVARNEDDDGKMVPWGTVYIHPDQSHTPFFSIVAALSAALAAGNVVALKFEKTTSTLSPLLQEILYKALSDDIFATVASDPPEEYLTSCLQVFQESKGDVEQRSHLTSSKRAVVAIVDRTANLKLAAESLVAGRFAFGGTSPYAPDLVLVNEFVKKEFIEHVLRYAIRFLADTTQGAEEKKRGSHSRRVGEIATAVSKLENWSPERINMITRGDQGCIVELVRARDEIGALPPKMTAPIFMISTISSLDDAIDFTSPTDAKDGRLLASFHFASPKHAKYLAQFVSADVTFVNHIPPQLLVGPAAPVYHQFDLKHRYLVQHFMRSAPTFISSPGSIGLAHAAKSVTDTPEDVIVTQLLAEATKEINVMKRPESIAIGFFQQGIYIGLGFYGIPLLTCLTVGLLYAIRGSSKNLI